MSIEQTLRHYVRAYEEVMLLDYAAALFQEHARNNHLTLPQLHCVLPRTSQAAVTKIFRLFDEDQSGTIDPNEFLKVVRYLNFGSGYCDGCDTPCYGQRAALHNACHQFRLTSDRETLQDYMPGLGFFLRSEIDGLFKEMDVDESGQVSHGEFRIYLLGQGFANALIDHFLRFDLNGDGYLSKSELLCIVVAMRITRFCDECGDWEFPGSSDMLSCVECTADYDVRRACFENGRCSHEHNVFEAVRMLQLRRLGLCLDIDDNDRRIVCDDPEKWSLYSSFFDEFPVEPKRTRGYSAYPDQGLSQLIAALNFSGHNAPTSNYHAPSPPVPTYAAPSFGHQMLKTGAKVVGEHLLDDFVGAVANTDVDFSDIAGNVGDVVGSLLSCLF